MTTLTGLGEAAEAAPAGLGMLHGAGGLDTVLVDWDEDPFIPEDVPSRGWRRWLRAVAQALAGQSWTGPALPAPPIASSLTAR